MDADHGTSPTHHRRDEVTLFRDCAYFASAFLAYLAYTRGPWSIMRGRAGLALLPMAGMYAYSESWKDFRDAVQWRTGGRPVEIDWEEDAP